MDRPERPNRLARLASGLSFFPLANTARGYNQAKLAGDARAALNVALLAFPQGMAYALIAGLPLSYGIYGSAIAAIVGAFFAGSKFIMLGPTNATAVMMMSAFASLGLIQEEAARQVPLLLALVGLILVLGAFFRVATLIQYISRTVVTGYIAAAASLIIANQIKNALGFTFAPDEKASNLIDVARLTALHIDRAQWPSVALSGVTLAIYLLLGCVPFKLPKVAITLALAAFAAYFLGAYIDGFEVELLPGMGAASLGLTLPYATFESIQALLPPAIAIALLSMLEGNSIGKSLAAREGGRIDANQEMLNAGLANIGCALFSGMAASGSLTRSQLNANSGAQTPLSSLYAGLLVLLGAFSLGPLIDYIPQASLAVLVIIIGISLINKHQLLLVTRTTGSDRATFFVTFLSGLVFSLDLAIYLGTVTSIALFLKKVSHPEIVEYGFNPEGQLGELKERAKRSDPEVSIVHVEGELFFGAAELFRDQMRRVSDDPNLKVVILKLRNAHNLDATSCMAFEELIRYMRERDRVLLVSEIRPDTMRILEKSGVARIISEENIFPDEAGNPTLSTAKALRRAKQILGDREAKVSIYAKDRANA